jgi:hypothetical protein
MFVGTVTEARVISQKVTMSYTYYLEMLNQNQKLMVKKDLCV